MAINADRLDIMIIYMSKANVLKAFVDDVYYAPATADVTVDLNRFCRECGPGKQISYDKCQECTFTTLALRSAVKSLPGAKVFQITQSKLKYKIQADEPTMPDVAKGRSLQARSMVVSQHAALKDKLQPLKMQPISQHDVSVLLQEREVLGCDEATYRKFLESAAIKWRPSLQEQMGENEANFLLDNVLAISDRGRYACYMWSKWGDALCVNLIDGSDDWSIQLAYNVLTTVPFPRYVPTAPASSTSVGFNAGVHFWTLASDELGFTGPLEQIALNFAERGHDRIPTRVYELIGSGKLGLFGYPTIEEVRAWVTTHGGKYSETIHDTRFNMHEITGEGASLSEAVKAMITELNAASCIVPAGLTLQVYRTREDGSTTTKLGVRSTTFAESLAIRGTRWTLSLEPGTQVVPGMLVNSLYGSDELEMLVLNAFAEEDTSRQERLPAARANVATLKAQYDRVDFDSSDDEDVHTEADIAARDQAIADRDRAHAAYEAAKTELEGIKALSKRIEIVGPETDKRTPLKLRF